jgi:hypothetical protein
LTESALPKENDPCQGRLHPEALEGLRLFNAGKYFEAHEALETAWRDEPGPVRDLYQGILQVGVGYYHLLNGNYSGALKLFARCKPLLEPFGDRCRGIDLAGLRRNYLAVEAEVRRLGPEYLSAFNRHLLRPIAFNLSEETSQAHGET